jgi:NAD(P)-dependent dehydrogenase (short-subunit alcohol dehydrogenase family)
LANDNSHLRSIAKTNSVVITGAMAAPMPRAPRRLAVLTGALGGIGREILNGIVASGEFAAVALPVRSGSGGSVAERSLGLAEGLGGTAPAAKTESGALESELPGGFRLFFFEAELSLFASVSSFAAALVSDLGLDASGSGGDEKDLYALTLLVNNAAICPPKREETTEGIELAFATNVLSYLW